MRLLVVARQFRKLIDGVSILRGYYPLFFLLAFLLNFVWESWHCVYLYDRHVGTYMEGGRDLKEFVHLITYASFIDAVLLTSLVVAGALVWRDWLWFRQWRRYQWLAFVMAAVVIAVGIEYKAVVVLNQWAYSDMMPTVFGLGVSPLVQLAVTGVVAGVLVRTKL